MTEGKKELTDEELWAQLDAQDAATTQGDPAAKTNPATTQQASEPATGAAPAKPTATAPATETASNEADPFADLPPHVQDFIAGQKAQNEALNKRLKNLEGNLGGMKQQLDAARTAQAQVQSAGAAAPTAQQIAAARGNAGKWAKLVEQYPEFGEAFEERLASVQGQGPAAQNLTIDQVAAHTSQAVAAAVARANDEMTVEFRHPGWQDLTQTPGFVGWVQRQQPEVVKLYSSDKPGDVIRLLDLYKEANKTSLQRQTRMSAAAAAAGPGTAKGAKVRSEAELDGQALWDALESQGR